jgi:aryl-alcohol dehydrogenase-like predicted oxidoreductase
MMIAPRNLGRSGVALSPLAFGSMRLNERALDDAAWERLLRGSIERGITTFHASTEYETHARFCGLLRRVDRTGLQVIVKLAEPHFGDAAFEAARFRRKIEDYRTDLGVDCVDVVQWMWRGDLKDEAGRLAGFARQRDEISDAFAALRGEGMLGAVAPFPYSVGFADAVIEAAVSEGITVYLNPVEREMVPQIERAARAGMGTIAIRPLAAGKALATASPVECVREVLAQGGVATAVVSYSSSEHLDALLGAANN